MANLAMDFRHVTIIHSEDGVEWVDYLLKYFHHPDLQLRVETLNLDNLTYEDPPELIVSLQESYVSLILMSAGVLDYIEYESSWMSKTFRLCNADVNRVMAVLCHVGLGDVTETCQKGNYDISTWELTPVEMDGSNVRDIVSSALQCIDENKTKRNKILMNNKDLLTSPGICEIYPSTFHKIGEKIALVFKCEINGEVRMVIRKKEVSVNMINPYCFVCCVPELPFGKHTATIFVGGEVKAKCRIKYKPFIPNSLELLMETYNVQKKEELDSLLADKYSQSVCNDPMLMKIKAGLTPTAESKRPTKYPSLIHWAAENGLKELCSQMLMSPEAVSLCAIENCEDKNAADMAGINGHTELEEYINDYLETELYVEACGLYVQTRGLEDDSIYEDMTGYQIPNRLKKNSLPAIGLSQTSQVPPPLKPRPRARSDSAKTELSVVSDMHLSKPKEIKLPDAAVGCQSQNELIDIMEDFKTGNFSIGEVEMLFRSWKERYKSGKAFSFKEKQRFLMDFRQTNTKILPGKRGKHNIGQSTIKEEDETLHVSEPVIPRKPTVGLPSKRMKDETVRGASDASTDSSSSSASYDSGRGSDQSFWNFSSNRKSLIFDNWSKDQEPIEAPPLPPRTRIKPKVYSRQKKPSA